MVILCSLVFVPIIMLLLTLLTNISVIAVGNGDDDVFSTTLTTDDDLSVVVVNIVDDMILPFVVVAEVTVLGFLVDNIADLDVVVGITFDEVAIVELGAAATLVVAAGLLLVVPNNVVNAVEIAVDIAAEDFVDKRTVVVIAVERFKEVVITVVFGTIVVVVGEPAVLTILLEV